MEITRDNCVLVDYTDKTSVHGTPPLPIYKILLSFKITIDPPRNKSIAVELLSNEHYQYRDAEKIRDDLVQQSTSYQHT